MMRHPPKAQNVDIIITGNVAWNKDLGWETKLFYGVIRGYCRNDFYCCYASNEYLAALLERDERSVRRMLTDLVDVGAVFRAKGYVFSEEGDIFFAQRLIVPTELKRQFEKAQEVMLDMKVQRQKNARQADKYVLPGAEKFVHLSSNKVPYEKNNISNNSIIRNNPQTPLQGGNNAEALTDNAVTSSETEQFETFGKFENVRLTQSQRRLLSKEFGEEIVLSLLEQLSAYIKSGVKRVRKKADHYALLRDWALRRRQPKPPERHKQAIIYDISRATYSQEELDALFTKLPDDDG